MDKIYVVTYSKTSWRDEDDCITDNETRVFINKGESCRYAFNKALVEYNDYKKWYCNINKNGKYYVDGEGEYWENSSFNDGEPCFNKFGCYTLLPKEYGKVRIVTHEIILEDVQEEGFLIEL